MHDRHTARPQHQTRPRRHASPGISAIFIAVSILLIGVLAGLMSSMLGSSSHSISLSNLSQRALYLAESGIRYARGAFRQALPAQKSQLLDDMHRKTYNLGSGEAFRNEFGSYWLYLDTAKAAGATSMNLKFPGRASTRLGTLPANGVLEIGGALYSYTNGVSVTETVNGVTETTGFNCTLAGGGLLFPLDPGYVALPVATVNTVAGNTLTVTTGGFNFPSGNGHLQIGTDVYYYDTASVSGGTTTITNVRTGNGTSPASLGVASGNNAVMLGHLDIQTFGQAGSAAVMRDVQDSFRAEQLFTVGIQSNFVLSFDIGKDQLDNFFDPADASEVDIKQTKEIDGDNALNLKSDMYNTGLKWRGDDYDGANQASEFVGLNFEKFRDDSNDLLTYEVQCKFYVDPNILADAQGNQEEHFFMTGISVRLDNANNGLYTYDFNNMYGVSFFRGRKLNYDTIHNGREWRSLFPSSEWKNLLVEDGNSIDDWYIILWKREGDRSEKKDGTEATYHLLAYKKLNDSYGVIKNASLNPKFQQWSTIKVRVNEELDASNNRYNEIWVSVASPAGVSTHPAYPRWLGSPAHPPLFWSEGTDTRNNKSVFKLIEWDGVLNGAAYLPNYDGTTLKYAIKDSSFTSTTYDHLPMASLPLEYPREVGLHIFFDAKNADAANESYYDNLAILLGDSRGNPGDAYLAN